MLIIIRTMLIIIRTMLIIIRTMLIIIRTMIIITRSYLTVEPAMLCSKLVPVSVRSNSGEPADCCSTVRLQRGVEDPLP